MASAPLGAAHARPVGSIRGIPGRGAQQGWLRGSALRARRPLAVDEYASVSVSEGTIILTTTPMIYHTMLKRSSCLAWPLAALGWSRGAKETIDTAR